MMPSTGVLTTWVLSRRADQVAFGGAFQTSTGRLVVRSNHASCQCDLVHRLRSFRATVLPPAGCRDEPRVVSGEQGALRAAMGRAHDGVAHRSCGTAREGVRAHQSGTSEAAADLS